MKWRLTMLSTYRATLRGQFLEWRNEKPSNLAKDQAVDVHVTILEESPAVTEKSIQGQRMAEALEQLARLQSSSLPADPMLWEREMREDRSLPDRDE